MSTLFPLDPLPPSQPHSATSAATAQLIARVPDAALREEFADEVLEPGWPKKDGEVLSFREAKEMLEAEYMVELKGAPFKTADRTLLPEMGSCKTCSLRVGILAMADPETYKGVRADVCTSPECYRKKCDAQKTRDREQAERQGFEVLDDAQAQALFGPSGHVNGVHWFDLADRCWDVEDEKTMKSKAKPRTWAQVLDGPPRINVQRYLAHDRHGTPHTLVKAVPARKALIAAGIIHDKDWAAEQPGDRDGRASAPSPCVPARCAAGVSAMPVKDTAHAVSIVNDLMKRLSDGKAVIGNRHLIDALQHVLTAARQRESLVEVNADLRLQLEQTRTTNIKPPPLADR